MIKSNDITACINQESIDRIQSKMLKYVNELTKINKEIHIEKIAFSLFCMHYYSHDFTYLLEDYLIDLKIKGLKDLWELGKSKDKLQFFFNLAEKFYEVKFDK